MKRTDLAAIASLLASTAFGVLCAAPGCSVDLGTAPALCSDGTCPEGYDCIHGVCALPGTPVPITVVSLNYLRGVDLRMVPTSGGALIVWQAYHYDTELHDFAAERIFGDGTTSNQAVIVGQYPADSNYLEPYFDLHANSDDDLFLAVGAAPPPGDTYSISRLTFFHVSLSGQTSHALSAASDELWELRVPSIGYGAVSEPRFAEGPSGLELGYFQSLTAADAKDATKKDTLGQLAIFQVGKNGSIPPGTKDCLASTCFAARADLPVAVSVVDTFTRDDSVFWIIDYTRPSFVLENATALPANREGALPELAIPVDATGSSLTFIAPSARTGEKLSDDPVEGPAKLEEAKIGASPTVGMTLPGIRDTPRPAYVVRKNKPELIVTPGTDVSAPKLEVYALEGTQATLKASIPRYSSQEIGSVRALVSDGKLFVTWLDIDESSATVRAAVLPEP